MHIHRCNIIKGICMAWLYFVTASKVLKGSIQRGKSGHTETARERERGSGETDMYVICSIGIYSQNYSFDLKNDMKSDCSTCTCIYLTYKYCT